MIGHLSKTLWVLIALLAFAPTARAQSDLSLLSQSVPPNVMILLDTSGSMRFAINHDDFKDPNTNDFWKFNDRAPVNLRSGTYVCQTASGNNLGNVTTFSGTTCPGSNDPNNTPEQCPNTDRYGDRWHGGNQFRCRNVPGGCTYAPDQWSCSVSGSYTYLRPPNYSAAEGWTTGYARNYIYWVVQKMHAGVKLDLPETDRMHAAKQAIKDLIDAINVPSGTEKVHFGLARFDSSNNGARIIVGSGPGTRTAIFDRLDDWGTGSTDTPPNGSTPLSESLVDIGRYFAGSHKLRNGSNEYSAYSRNDYTGSVPGTPIDATCRYNFAVVITDGAPTSDLNNHHGSDFTNVIGNADGDTNESPNPWAGRPAQDYLLPYDANSGSDWLDDVAYFLADPNNDLIPDTTLDEDQVVITYTVGFAIDHPLLQDTADNGKGQYFQTNNSSGLVSDLTEVLTEIVERSSSLTSATVPSSRTAFGDGFYTAFFLPSTSDPFWQGHLQAFRLTPDLDVVDKDGNAAIDATTNEFIEPRNPYWDAADSLLAQSSRTLYTNKSGARVTFDSTNVTATDFGISSGEWTSYPYDPNVTIPTPASAETARLATDLIAYMEGFDPYDQDEDSDTTEKRAHILGDIFHSNPISVGPPPSALNAEQGYGPVSTSGTFLYTHKDRDRRIYVGANDGILHAFDGGSFNLGDNPATTETEDGYYDQGTGEEIFGWVPGSLLDTVKYIPRNNPRSYYYVDGNPSAADVWFPGTTMDLTKDGSEWTTILVTGNRQGGAGYLALDITDPTATAAPHGPYPLFLWEFDDSAEPLGEAWSEPIITRVKMKGLTGIGDNCGEDDGDGDCKERWVVIISGGYDVAADPNLGSYEADPNASGWTDKGKAVFILDAQDGTVLAKLAYDSADATLSRMNYAIPSTPGVLDLDFDGFADVIYVGDLGGQLWKWDIHAVGVDADTDGLVDSTVWPAGIFFSSPASTVASGLHYHSIFFPPVATYVDGELMLAFASGERSDLPYEGAADPNATLEGLYDDNNRFWAVIDRNPIGTNAFTVWVNEDGNVDSGIPVGVTNSLIDDISLLAADPTTSDDGYFIKVPDGQKFITNHIIFAGVFLSLAYKPDNSGTSICDVIGETFVYVFDLETGSGLLDDSGSPVRTLKLGNGAPTDPRISVSQDSNGDTIVQMIGQTSLGEVLKLPVPADPPPPVDLVYWRQRF